MQRIFMLYAMLIWSARIASAEPEPFQLASPPESPAHEWYCDPVKGSTPVNAKELGKGNGTKANPWGTLESVAKAKLFSSDPAKGVVRPGDTVWLLDGHHGMPNIQNVVNSEFITLAAVNKGEASVDSIVIVKSAKFAVRGLRIGSPKIATQLVLLAGEDYLLEDCIIEPVADATKYTNEEWSTGPKYGIQCNVAKSTTIRNNTIRNIKFGMSLNGEKIICEGNTVDYFCNDGINFTCSHSIFRGNTVKNHYAGLGENYHYDGMQGFAYNSSPEYELTDLVIDGNTVIASTGEYETIPPVPTGEGVDYLHGISVFDGACRNFTVTNNIVQCASHHGLAFYGLCDSKIENNTIVLLSKNRALRGKIGLFIGKPKFGAIIPTNVTIRNNIANTITVDPKILAAGGVIIDHNLIFEKSNKPLNNLRTYDPKKVFTSYDPARGRYDLRLRENSPAIGGGAPIVTEQVTTSKVRKELRPDVGAIPSKRSDK